VFDTQAMYELAMGDHRARLDAAARRRQMLAQQHSDSRPWIAATAGVWRLVARVRPPFARVGQTPTKSHG
jgi:hypothetical protein